ncbi:MAG: sporulation protein YqfD [Clostridium sp.]
MGLDKLKRGKISVEIKVLNPERILNILWNNKIKVSNVKKVDIATLRVDIDYNDYEELRDIINKINGRMEIIGSNGLVFLFGRLKRYYSLVIGAVIFIGIMFYLSTYIWGIEIETKKNVAPFEIRQQLYDIGIKSGIKKNSIEVKEIERALEDVNSDILWIRVRIEGSTLKVIIEEKINPPIKYESKFGNLVAKMDGQINTVYTYSGRTAVKRDDYVVAGEVLIEGIDGKEEEQFEVVPNGIVMANTFYEKSMEVKIDGTSIERSGRKDSDIYIKIFGKKLYIKKAIKNFKEYDKIEESGKILNKVVYFEREEKEIKLTKEEAIENSIKSLEESLLNELTREAIIVDKIIKVDEGVDSNIIVKVDFVVEQNILDYNVVEY